jgi:hypothetical protein
MKSESYFFLFKTKLLFHFNSSVLWLTLKFVCFSVWANRSIKIACLKLQLKFWVESFHLHTCSFVSRMYVKLKKTTSRRRLFGIFMNNNFNRLVWLSLFLDLDCQQIFMISLLALPNLRLGNFFPFLFLSNRNWHSLRNSLEFIYFRQWTTIFVWPHRPTILLLCVFCSLAEWKSSPEKKESLLATRQMTLVHLSSRFLRFSFFIESDKRHCFTFHNHFLGSTVLTHCMHSI